MKITLTTPYYPPHIGGVEIHVQNLARWIMRIGYDVEVITSFGKDEVVKVKTVRCIHFPYTPIPLKFPKIECDIVHSHIPSPFFAKCVMEKHVKPHIVTYHNDVVIPTRVNGIFIPREAGRIIEKININITIPILDSADLIIATTESYAKTSPILSQYDVKIIPNAIDIENYEYSDNKQNFVVYVGRLVEYKGLTMLIEAMKIVQREFPIKLVVVGDGEDRKMFEMFARKLNVAVEFKGKVSEKEKIKIIKNSKVLILPSRSRLEAFGIVLLEAMACGTPVIGSNIPGVRDIAKEGGMVFNSVEDLAEKILKIITNDKLCKLLGKRGRKTVEEKYSWNVVIKRLKKIYDSF